MHIAEPMEMETLKPGSTKRVLRDDFAQQSGSPFDPEQKPHVPLSTHPAT